MALTVRWIYEDGTVVAIEATAGLDAAQLAVGNLAESGVAMSSLHIPALRTVRIERDGVPVLLGEDE